MTSKSACGCHPDTHPIDLLEQEHAVILRVLDAADAERVLMERGAPLRVPYWHKYLDFLANYADTCHHRKEEDVLFAALEAAGMPSDSGPTSCMRVEHAEMRGIRARLAEALTSDDIETVCHLIEIGTDTLRRHIGKENNVLFPMARQMLTPENIAEIRRGFNKVETDMGEGTHCHWEEIAESLAADIAVSS